MERVATKTIVLCVAPILLGATLLVISPTSGQAADAMDEEAEMVRPARQGGVRRWEVDAGDAHVRSEPTMAAAESVPIDAGSLLENLGCALADGTLWCEVGVLGADLRGYTERTLLKPALGPDGTVPSGPNDSRRRARSRNFDINATIRCAQEVGQSLGDCKAASARAGGGDATIVVTFPNGFSRSLYFVHGAFISANSTMSGVGTDTEWTQVDGLYTIRVDDQRYLVPRELVTGR